jgi:Arc/MetJ-type ribon-helix-helix transcriptional regulator
MSKPTIAADLSTDSLEAALRRGLRDSCSTVRAAVELLIEHGYWTRRRDFVKRAVKYWPHADQARIDWSAAAQAAADLRGSTSELAILEFAAALGKDQYRWNVMGLGHHGLILRSVRTALNART